MRNSFDDRPATSMDRLSIFAVVILVLAKDGVEALNCPDNTFTVITKNDGANRDVFKVSVLNGTVWVEDNNAVFPSPDKAGSFIAATSVDQTIELTLNYPGNEEFILLEVSMDTKQVDRIEFEGDIQTTGGLNQWSTWDFELSGTDTRTKLVFELHVPGKEYKLSNMFLRGCVPVEWCQWGKWECNVECGTGIQKRERVCECPNPDPARFFCRGLGAQEKACVEPCCPQPPKWGNWNKWGECDVSCGNGKQERRRQCEKDACPDGSDCVGNKVESKSCNAGCCPVPPQWGEWQTWGKCDVTCGKGSQTRKRDCVQDSDCPNNGPCSGSVTDTKECDAGCCPVPPQWGDWKKWSDCPVTCGGGSQTRRRDCEQDADCSDNGSCGTEDKQTQQCNTDCCPVPPQWGDWKKWSDCPVTCGGGSQTRLRDCEQDADCPDNGSCGTENKQTQQCNTDCCPVPPQWGDWKKWSDCPVTCGGGSQTRRRDCEQDADCPNNGSCGTEDKQTQQCNTDCCPVPPQWGDWKKWSDCPVTCGGGSQTRRRDCEQDADCPDNGSCGTENNQTQQCNTDCCPVPPQWGDWKKWSDCPVTCGIGIQNRRRDCEQDADCQDNGSCGIEDKQTKECDAGCCPVPAEWSAWKPWSECTVTCDVGSQSRSRTCEQNIDCPSGNNCDGKKSDTRECDMGCCPVAPKLKKWASWGPCELPTGVTCGDGEQTRKRKCKKDKQCPLVGGTCDGPKSETQTCDGPCCPEKINFNSRGQISIEVIRRKEGAINNRKPADSILLGSGEVRTLLFDNWDGKQGIFIDMKQLTNVVEVGFDVMLVDSVTLDSSPAGWSDTQPITLRKDSVVFKAPGGGFNVDTLEINFGMPTAEMVVKVMYIVICE